MAEKNLVIVESPTKARTIKRFLPKNFVVEASMGHVRDLPRSAAEIPAKFKKEPWAKIGINIENDFEPLYVISKGKSKVIAGLRKLLKTANALYLATDEDREGESISWHLVQLLKPKIPVKRMVFDEITKSAIQKALEECRDIDSKLVSSQETRRILDRLVGYTLSPLIWKKIAYGLSAGRVQSAGLRLLVERERERAAFVKATYWDLKATLEKEKQEFEAKLISVEGKRLATGKDFDDQTGKLKNSNGCIALNEKQAKALLKDIEKAPWKVHSVEKKEFTSRPYPPFITSTLQQEANLKLGLSARQTMRTAQTLYEQGLITYMRTDSPHLSNQAIEDARVAIKKLYGANYLSPTPRQFTSKSKLAQEAHEAIRPTGDQFFHPKDTNLRGVEFSLYELIWKRTVASQMAEAKKLSISAKVESGKTLFSASGMKILFPGFLRAYVEGTEDPENALGNRETLLPELNEGDSLTLIKLEPLFHETKPPARFTEASLVSRLEKEGIGRPSTYASIIGTILERNYARKVGNALVPTFTGIAVIQLLEKHFSELVDYKFTSQMEEDLDEIAEGARDSLPYLKKFYLGNQGLMKQVEKKENQISAEESRSVQMLELKEVDLRVGRFGPYVIKNGKKGKEEVRASIPEDIPPADLTVEKVTEIIQASEKGPQSLGKHPETGQDVYVLLGRYGPYVQLGEAADKDSKPKRASVPKEFDYQTLTLEQATKLLSLPRELGKHPETKTPIIANRGRFGPYIAHGDDFRSVKKDDDVYTITLKRALEILAQEKRGKGRSKVIKDLGSHPDTHKKLTVHEGKYGPYLKHGRKNLSLPKDVKPESMTLEKAVELIGK